MDFLKKKTQNKYLDFFINNNFKIKYNCTDNYHNEKVYYKNSTNYKRLSR